MKLKYAGFIFVLICATQFTVAQETVDIDSLIKEISINSQKDAFSNYSYKMEFVRHNKALIGKNKLVKRFDVVLPSRMPKDRVYQHRLLLVYDNSKRLTQSDILESRKKIIKDLERVESEPEEETPTQNDPEAGTGGYLTLLANASSSNRQSLLINLLKLIEGSDFSNYKELKAEGRDTISVDFRPHPGLKFTDDLFYLERIEGVILIDKMDRRIVEVEAFPIGKLDEYRSLGNKRKDEVRVFHYLQTRVPEGFWFPKSVSLNFMEFSDKFDGLDVKIDFTFSKYKRFTVSVDNYNQRVDSNRNNNDPQEEKPDPPIQNTNPDRKENKK